jgi:membrane protease YdiL (CAAX protease family)
LTDTDDGSPADGRPLDPDIHPDAAVQPAPEPAPPTASPRPGVGTFTIEGRAAPGLFVVGWLATILGVGLLIVGYASPRSVAASILLIVAFTLLSIGLVVGAGGQAIERRARGEAYAGPSPYLLFLASVVVSSFLGSLIGLFARLFGIEPGGLGISILVLAVIQLTYVSLTRLLVVGTNALSWEEMGFRPLGRAAFGEVAYGLALAIPLIAITVVISAIAFAVFPVAPESPLPATGTTIGLILNLLGGAVLVPIGEETLFRGVSTTAWSRVYGASRAIIQGGLFFALVHVIQVGGADLVEAAGLAVVAFVTRIPIALALGSVFLRRHSIWASMGLHAGFNGVLLILGELAVRSGLGN